MLELHDDKWNPLENIVAAIDGEEAILNDDNNLWINIATVNYPHVY